MLYTIVPLETIFSNEVENDSYSYEEYALNNCTLELYRSDTTNEYKIKRVISTDPAVYLQDIFQPGMVINEAQLMEYKKTI